MIRIVFACFAILLGLGSTASAHAILVEAVPPVRGSIAGPEVVFRLKFNSRIDAARSTLTLLLPDGRMLTLALADQPSPDTLTARSAHLRAGRHTLRWQVLAADGHITRGEVPFDIR